MSTRTTICMIAVSVLLASASLAPAGGPAPQRLGLRNRSAGEGLLHGAREHQCENCRIEMRTITRMVYEPVEETRQATVYDVITEQQTINETQRVPVTQYREEPYTYHRTVVETQMREVPYTTCRPVHETQTREVPYLTYVPVTETRTHTVPYTVHQRVEEQRTRTVYHSVPRQVCSTRTVQVRSGYWGTCAVNDPAVSQKGDDVSQKGGKDSKPVCKRVWVPCVEEREVTETRTVHDLKAEVVPYTVCRTVPVTLTRDVQRTYTRMVPVRQTRTVDYQVVRMVTEQHVRTVPYVVKRAVPESGTRVVSYLTYQEVPTTRVVDVPRQVPRTVCYKVTRMVPRTQCIQVPVKICDPKGKGGKGDHEQKGDLEISEADDVPAPAMERAAEAVAPAGAAPPTDAVATVACFVEG